MLKEKSIGVVYHCQKENEKCESKIEEHLFYFGSIRKMEINPKMDSLREAEHVISL